MAQPNPVGFSLVMLARRASLKAEEGVQAAKRAASVVVGDGLGLLGVVVAIVSQWIGRLFRRLPSLRHILAAGAIVGVPLAGATALGTWIEAGSTVGVMGAQPGTPVSAVAWAQQGNVAAIGTYDGRILLWDHAARRSLATLQASGTVMALQLFEGGPTGSPALRVFARTVGGRDPGYAAPQPQQQQQPVQQSPQQQQQQQQQQVQQPPPQQQQQRGPNVSGGDGLDAGAVYTRVVEWVVASDGTVQPPKQLAADGDPATGRRLHVVPARSGSSGGTFGGGANAPVPSTAGSFVVLDNLLSAGMSELPRAGANPAGRVTAALLADDGSTLSALGLDSGIIMVDSRKVSLTELDVPVTALAAGPSAQVFFAATAGGNVVRYDLSGNVTTQLYGNRPWTVTAGPVLTAHKEPLVADIAADGSRAVTASADGVMQLWELNQVPPRASQAPRQDVITHLALSDDGSLLVTAAQNGSLRAWSLSGGTGFARDLRGHQGAVTNVALSPDRAFAAAASDDGNVRVWDLRQSTEPSVLRVGEKVNHVAFHPDSQRIAAAGEDGTTRVWNIGAPTAVELKGHRGPVLRARFSPDGTRLITVARDDGGRLWDLRADPPVSLPLVIQGATFLDGVFSPDGTKVAVTAMDGDVWVWDFSGPSPRTVGLKGPGRAAWSPSFGPQGRSLAVGYADGTAALWDLSGAIPRAATLRGHGKAVTQAKIVGNGETVFTASADGTARLWRVQPTVSAHAAPVIGLHASVLSSDAAFARTKERAQALSVRQQALSNELSRIDAENRRRPAGTNDEDLDRRIAEIQREAAVLEQQTQQLDRAGTVVDLWSVAENGEAMLWAWRTDVPVVKVEHGSRVAASGVVRDLLFTAGDDGIVRLHDAFTGSLVGMIAGHAAPLTHATISAQARYLLSADADGVVRITDIGRARWIWRLEGWPDSLPSLSSLLDRVTALVRGEGNPQQAGTAEPVQQRPLPSGSGPTAR